MFDGPLRVAVIDDSALYRQMILNVLGRIAGVEVVGTAADGDAAVELVARVQPDVITLDVQMPGRDGIEVLRELRQRRLAPLAIMISSLTAQGAPATVAALMEGAFDVILKPIGVDPHVSRELIHQELSEKLAAVRESLGADQAAAVAVPPPWKTALRPSSGTRFDCVVIGTSTGGPQALRAVIPQLPAELPAAVMVVQHIPPQFTSSLAARLDSGSMLRVVEAAEGMTVEKGRVLLAPGGMHLAVSRRDEHVVCVLDDGPRRHGCRPSLDHLLESAAALYGSRVLAIVLTGMGCDGVEGCRAVRERGGRVIAQAAEGCVVFGMPKAVITAGLADEVVPLEQVAATVIGHLR
jgi:two-component system, chemotaxis family, protein-glutamate methylesterase/glutaminase